MRILVVFGGNLPVVVETSIQEIAKVCVGRTTHYVLILNLLLLLICLFV